MGASRRPQSRNFGLELGNPHHLPPHNVFGVVNLGLDAVRYSHSATISQQLQLGRIQHVKEVFVHGCVAGECGFRII
jgi:hypothetical protein